MTAQTTSDYRVMVVDDNDGDLELLKEAIRAGGMHFEIVAFNNARAALAHLDAGNVVHLILSDLNMPSMNGSEFFSQVAQIPRLSGIPMAMMSSSSHSRLPAKITQKLMVPYFSKGITWGDFVRLAREIDGMLQCQIDAGGTTQQAQTLADRMTPRP